MSELLWLALEAQYWKILTLGAEATEEHYFEEQCRVKWSEIVSRLYPMALKVRRGDQPIPSEVFEVIPRWKLA